VSGLYGDVSGLSGNVSGLYGDVTGITGKIPARSPHRGPQTARNSGKN